MTPARTVRGRVLLDLVERLGRYRSAGLEPRDRATIVFVELATVPMVWPLDDLLFELLLTTAGFDLHDADDLHGAVWAAALLIAGDPSYDGLWCAHEDDDPSPFCNMLRHDVDMDGLYCEVMDMRSAGAFETCAELRRLRHAQYGVDDTGSGLAA